MSVNLVKGCNSNYDGEHMSDYEPRYDTCLVSLDVFHPPTMPNDEVDLSRMKVPYN